MVSTLAQATAGALTRSPSGPTTVTDNLAVSPAVLNVNDGGSTVTTLVHRAGSSVSSIVPSQASREGGRHRPDPPTTRDSSPRFANVPGTRPDTLVAATLRVRRLSRSPSSAGSSPMIPLLLSVRSRSRARLPTSGGMSLESRFRLRSRVTNWSSEPMEEWIHPLRLLPLSDKPAIAPSSSVSTPNHSESGASVSQLVLSLQFSPPVVLKRASRTSRCVSGIATFTSAEAVTESVEAVTSVVPSPAAVTSPAALT